MRCVVESWWWVTIASIAFVIYGGTFPSDPVREPGMPRVAYTALGVSVVMLLLSLSSWAWRACRRAH